MDKPHRVQLSRKKGWRMPENTVSVARPTKWGNPFPVESPGRWHPKEAGFSRPQAVLAFKVRMHGLLAIDAVDLSPLRGKNLACWCRLCDAHKHGKPFGVQCADCSPCHSDVLGDLANPADACGGSHE